MKSLFLTHTFLEWWAVFRNQLSSTCLTTFTADVQYQCQLHQFSSFTQKKSALTGTGIVPITHSYYAYCTKNAKKKNLNVQTSLVIHLSCTNYFSVQFYYSNQHSLSKQCQPLPGMGWQDPYVYAASSPVLWDVAVAPLQQYPLWKSSDPPLG